MSLIPDPENPDDVAQEFYMLLVKPVFYEDEEASDPDPGLELSNPKAFLRISSFTKLDSFSITHGSCTAVEGEFPDSLPPPPALGLCSHGCFFFSAAGCEADGAREA